MTRLAERIGRGFAARRDRDTAPVPEPLWLEWLALGGVLAFATWLLGVRGVWGLLLRSDPTGITLVIVLVFGASTLWCGARARLLQRESVALAEIQRESVALAEIQRESVALAEIQRESVALAGIQRESVAPAKLQRGPSGRTRRTPRAAGWAVEYLGALAGPAADRDTALDLLLEQTHGPHATAWWVNGIQLKLGLLGKVIGFSILALTIGNAPSFDAAQSQELLRSLTTGLGVALLTTMVGLVGNILLGLQLTRLDRFADRFVADAQRLGLAVRGAPGASA